MEHWPQSRRLTRKDRDLLLLTKELRQSLDQLINVLERIPAASTDPHQMSLRLELSSAAVSIGLIPASIGSFMLGSFQPYWLTRDLLTGESLALLRELTTPEERSALERAIEIDRQIRDIHE